MFLLKSCTRCWISRWSMTNTAVCCDEFPMPQIDCKSKQVKEQWDGKVLLSTTYTNRLIYARTAFHTLCFLHFHVPYFPPPATLCRVFMSHIFHPSSFVLHFPVLNFHVPHFQRPLLMSYALWCFCFCLLRYFLFLVTCGRPTWPFISFWVHVNIV